MALNPPPMVMIGDSHMRPFKRAAAAGRFAPRGFRLKHVGGATARGLINEKSHSGAGDLFRRFLIKSDPAATFIPQFGEIDCNFSAWAISAKRGTDPEAEIDASLTRYFQFLDREAPRFAAVLIAGPPPPVLTAEAVANADAELRRSVTASLQDRLALTRRFAAGLRAGATARGWGYCDVIDRVNDRETGAVHQRFRHPNPGEHHLHPNGAAVPWGRVLTRALNAMGR